MVEKFAFRRTSGKTPNRNVLQSEKGITNFPFLLATKIGEPKTDD
jgi:hypothetical protein